MQAPLVEILMATYNGAPFLAAQIESILAQSYRNWRLVIHDDGSSDGTVQLVRDYALRFPKQITLMDDGIAHGSAKHNFAHLMGHATAGYVMLADQDDIWLPNKVQHSMDLLMAEEKRLGKHMPVAVFTDLVVVDEELEVVAPSFWAFQNLRPQRLVASIENLAVRNCITGCTLLMNKSALSVCLPVPEVAVMHDWWCGLKILQGKGKLIPLHSATILYRQHSGNVVGARQWGVGVIFRKILGFRRYRQEFWANYMMAKHFLPDLNIISFFLRKIMLAIR
ncbi:family 2 glycosyl transferase [Pollutimonas nitritireducens]|uniref:Family 2 glycosyl transferase n=1 Tax=Pollutimonas nitritireducens TaxID=2045209 RepID=A0A2N4UBV4_9BURK|nr:glycosyltransferase family 2 protein [Pollutimonas nitritireducens]PLC52478.1 family 2 glycosyl transferase [Pollutimonas nitritireducens]